MNTSEDYYLMPPEKTTAYEMKLIARLDELLDENLELETTIDSLHGENDELKTAVADLQAEQNETATDRDYWKSEFDILWNQYEKLRKENDELDNLNNLFRNKINRMERV